MSSSIQNTGNKAESLSTVIFHSFFSVLPKQEGVFPVLLVHWSVAANTAVWLLGVFGY